MSVYTLPMLMRDLAGQRKSRLKAEPGQNKGQLYEDLWAALNGWINNRLDAYKGVNITQFATFTWETFSSYKGKAAGGGYAERKRPFFQLTDSFNRSHGLPLNGGRKPAQLAKTKELNCTEIAIKFSKVLTKDQVFSGLRDIFTKIGNKVELGGEVAIGFDVGVFHARERKVDFEFVPTLSGGGGAMAAVPEEAQVEEYAAQPEVEEYAEENKGPATSMEAAPAPAAPMAELPLPEEEEWDSEEEERRAMNYQPGTIDVLPSQRDDDFYDSAQARVMEENAVIESAYRRHLEHVRKMVEDTAFEKKEFIRNMQAQEREARRKRSHRMDENRNLQGYLVNQIEAKSKERKKTRERELNTPTHCSFPPLVKSAANGSSNRDKVDKADRQTQMMSALKAQIDHKNKMAAGAKSRSLAEERRFLEHVQEQMLDHKRKTFNKKLAVKQRLLEAWERDRKMKGLLKHGVKLQSTIRPSDTLDTARSEFSVGFDMRG